METARAILLRRSRFSDTSLIITWLTAGHGRIKTIAKGALRPKSAFAGQLDLFYECDIGFAYSRKSDLHILREAQLVNAFENIRTHWMNMRTASYFVELGELASQPDHPAEEVYRLLAAALDYLHRKSASRRVIERFESSLAKALGVGTAITAEPLAHISTVTELERTIGRLPPDRTGLIQQLQS